MGKEFLTNSSRTSKKVSTSHTSAPATRSYSWGGTNQIGGNAAIARRPPVIATGTALDVLRHGWHDAAITLAPDVPEAADLLEARLEMVVAAGRLDGYWERDIKPWDIAAGLILVREAGGFVTDCDGGDDMFATGNVIAGNDAIHKELLRVLKGAGKG